jgi:hypothetical protein
MTCTYSTVAATARLTAALIATSQAAGVSVDGRSSFGTLVIGTSGLSGTTGVLATIVLQKPSFSIVGKVATLLGVTLSVLASGSGTAALAELRDSDGNTVVSGLTVGTSATDIIITSTSITASETVSITAGTVTHP